MLCRKLRQSVFVQPVVDVADIVIDATGDASISQRAGIPTVAGENYMTYLAHMLDKESCLPDKDTNSIRKWESVGSDMSRNGHPKDMPKIICNSAIIMRKSPLSERGIYVLITMV